MFQHKLDVLVCHGNKIRTDQCHHHKDNSRVIDIHLIYSPEQPCKVMNNKLMFLDCNTYLYSCLYLCSSNTLAVCKSTMQSIDHRMVLQIAEIYQIIQDVKLFT